MRSLCNSLAESPSPACSTSSRAPAHTPAWMFRGPHRPSRSTACTCTASSSTAVPTRQLRGKARQEAAVTIQGLQVQFTKGSEQNLVLKGVDLEVKRGTLHMLLGPNGCGKSTLLKVLGGLVTPSAGTFKSDQPTGFVFQNPDHQVVMPTVAADVAFGLGRYDMPEEEVHSAVASALEVVNMSPYMHRATHTLSGGQRQRVAIAGALAENPRVLLLDELTTFLDMEDQFGVLDAVKGVTQRGSTSPADCSSNSNSSSSSSSSSSREGNPRQEAAQDDGRNGATSSSQHTGDGSNGHGSGSEQGGMDSPQSISQQQQQQQQEEERTGSVIGAANQWVIPRCHDREQQAQAQPVTAIWVTHRFEELDYADAVSYMQDGRVAFTGRPADMRTFLKSIGAPI
ncbi:P-loop containing nucleoside triphosphate hydrolase protein [Dunaliella salina]|uniref:P-loop containing nucleoside triphosphate hydrolase protein n=1 Tax=Dunaliella salina TaxID=3046 RepID=A0ABQ7GSV8_DUNSA|nr:P-loop containing nucleoside triphosphate hydrolase protein [Dunaliella salina]|eukprot:KAF5837704.1 P-loop containing nucleoside triphosphate hydrolase protein [Dunaliella salina]